MYRAHAWLLPGKSYKAVCQLHVPYRLRLLLDMKPCGDGRRASDTVPGTGKDSGLPGGACTALGESRGHQQ